MNKMSNVAYTLTKILLKPNTLGIDIFAFVLTDVGLVPTRIDNDSKNCDNLNVNYNWDCTYKVLGEK